MRQVDQPAAGRDGRPRSGERQRGRVEVLKVHVKKVELDAGVDLDQVAGLERKNRLLDPREREIVACHEIGHAIVASAIAGSGPVHKVSIIPHLPGAVPTSQGEIDRASKP